MNVVIHPDTPKIGHATRTTGVYLLGLLALGGVISIIIRLLAGMGVTNLTSNVAWGMWVVFYIYCIGLSAGSFLMSTVVYVFGMERFEKMGRMALISALLALAGGLTFVWIDLGHPFRFWKVFFNWQVSSVLAWEAALYIGYVAIILAELFLLMRRDLAGLRDESTGWRRRLYKMLAAGHRIEGDGTEQADRSRHTIKVLGIVGIPVAVGVHGGTGALFAVVAAKPEWFSGLFPIIFLVSALLSGAGLMLFLYAWFGRRDGQYSGIVDGLRVFVIAFIAVDVLLFLSDLLVSLYAGIPDQVAVWHEIAFGEYWYVFWFGQILLAWVIPLLLSVLSVTKKSALWLGVAGVSIVVGILAVRLNLVIPAYLFPQLPGLNVALPDARSAYSYFPSLLEWISSIGIAALLTLVFIAAWNLLPIYNREPDHDPLKGESV
ncbi:hypothetical protein MNBD_ACTINO02-2969 [hydrothermal vent metagenome]|uniref:Molybdopterin oxidoreductase n=1 Tax=hydrothermal vent metagenome TaxID=652676 RepID=A0A3B0S9H5_9ZZZZ